MPIRSFLTGLGLNQLFMLDDATLDPGSNGITTTFSTGTGSSFVNEPVCEGVSNSLRTNTIAGFIDVEAGGVIENTSDINLGFGIFQRRCVFLWARCELNDAPTVVYEQGGNVNNLAIITGLGGVFTAQAADQGDEFLIASFTQKTQVNRNYFLALIWERHTQHSGNGNRVAIFANGVLGEIYEGSGTDPFPNHSGDIVVGNTDDDLKTYNEESIRFIARRKWANMVGMINDSATFAIDNAATILREIFERSVIAETVIEADTVANQQAALTALDGTNYGDVNCAIRIYQATDATDYTLTLPDVTFTENNLLGNIYIQYVGPNTLSVQLTTAISPFYTSVPPEVETVAQVFPGGGTCTIVENITWSISGMQIGDELTIVRAADSTELFHVESTVTGSEDYNFSSTESGVAVTVLVFNVADKEPVALDLALPSSSGSLVIVQSNERVYANAA